MIKIFCFLCGLILTTSLFPQKPAVWIFTDMTDNTLPGKNHMGTINDPDDISAMAGYLLMANMFETKGIVIASTHRNEHANTPDQLKWVNDFFGNAYQSDLKGLNKNIGGYPDKIPFYQSSIKESAERYNPQKTYSKLTTYSTVRALLEAAETESDIINVLCWGSLTEPAIFVNYCMANKRTDLLEKIRFIAHWTNSPLHQGTIEHPENVANCREDSEACAYLKKMALEGHIKYYECGAIGQHGIVSGSPKGKEFYDKFRNSMLGTIFIEGKFVHNSVDHSDAATYWVLLGNWGVSLDDINSNGTNPMGTEKANEMKFKEWSLKIHNELLRRSNAASE